MKIQHLILAGLLLAFSGSVLASYSQPHVTASATYFGRNHVYGGGYYATPTSVDFHVNLPKRSFGYSASVGLGSYNATAYYFRNSSHGHDNYRYNSGIEYYRVGPRTVYVSNPAYENGHRASQGVNGYNYVRHSSYGYH